MEDEGAPDKRLFVTESEFAQALSASGRKDNTLGVILRNAWDGKSLRSLIKNGGKGADIASNPHVSILAHITAEELKVKLNATDAVNGFGNRFLWACVRRAQSLPFGGLNATARDIYERLRLAFPGELARTDLFGATNRHIRAEDLTRALAELTRHGLATSRKELTSGAPRDLWRLIAN